MRRLLFSSFFTVAALLSAWAQNVTGTVTCNGSAVSGVAVSDGVNVVTTDKQGRYALQSDKTNGYVFISIPRGYMVDMANGFAPQSWQKFSNASVASAEVHDFKLSYCPSDDYVMIVGADCQLAKRFDDVKTYKNGYLARLKEEKEKASNEHMPIYSTILGDLSWDVFWYSNKLTIADFKKMQIKMHYPLPLFPVMGNHDNDPSVPHSSATDFLAAKPWREVMGPNYYSYNIGKVHYVVLDNIVYKNDTLPAGKKARKGVWGQRDYDGAVTPMQISWLRQDLALVDKNAPVVVCSHIPTFRINGAFAATGSLKNYKELADCFEGFTNVHFLSGHTHYNYNAHPAEYPHIMEHNQCAIGGALWSTYPAAGTGVCSDGSPAGYSRWTVHGDSLEWKFVPIEFKQEPQFRVTDMNVVKQFLSTDKTAKELTKTFDRMPKYADCEENSMLINVFAWDDDWKIEVTENGKPLAVKRIHAIDPAFLLAYTLPRYKKLGELSGPGSYGGTRHIFKVMASSPSTSVKVKVTDSFGHEYSTTVQRPKPYTLDTPDR